MKEHKLRKVSNEEILGNSKIYQLFNNASFQKLKIKCRILTGDFFVDSYNYYPITKKNFYTFPQQFDWQHSGYNRGTKFENINFQKNFFKNSLKYKEISDVYVLGTSPGNNYYRNIYTFLFRLFFIPDKKVDIAIHRNTPNNIRNFILHILEIKKVKLGKFIFLDDGFYLFKNSQIPSFLDFNTTMKLSQFMFPSKKNNTENIYISRRNANWRKVVNETDFHDYLNKFDFEILDFENLPVIEQINKIKSAKRIISPHGSGLTNLIFSDPDSKVIEILNNKFEKQFSFLYLKYKRISSYIKNTHYFFDADLIENEIIKNNEIFKIEKYIDKKILLKSPYYKNFIIQEGEFKKLVTNFCKH